MQTLVVEARLHCEGTGYIIDCRSDGGETPH